MAEPIFNPDNVESFVRLTGDPNPLHYSSAGYRQIVPVFQLTGVAIQKLGWRPGLTLEMNFGDPIRVPSENEILVMIDPFAKTQGRGFPFPDYCAFSEGGTETTWGRLLKDNVYLDDLADPHTQAYQVIKYQDDFYGRKTDWESLNTLPRGERGLLPTAAYLVGAATNALARRLYANPDELRRRWIPGLSDEGTDAVKIETIKVQMNSETNVDNILIDVSAPQGDLSLKRPRITYGFRGYTTSVEYPIYTMELIFRMMPKRLLENILRP